MVHALFLAATSFSLDCMCYDEGGIEHYGRGKTISIALWQNVNVNLYYEKQPYKSLHMAQKRADWSDQHSSLVCFLLAYWNIFFVEGQNRSDSLFSKQVRVPKASLDWSSG